ncbi:N-formylglutamate deformylase, partial [Burkholderia pseudomallei]|nr:N-formylglutamate deformylase [Burkholderia pseudomallei]MBF3543206.1 N-formylglutamate deformylase [Burkholderia pseudomallei]MBF3605337.1 N-formylglutamate deformylase [Burkholderia pseudomallei]MBF3605344.1 N-formylglutamate deformylase [Burkholderia pseudomallei]
MNTASQPPVFTLHRGTLPLLVSIPHAGTHLPDDIAATMTPVARHVDDCDWHLE